MHVYINFAKIYAKIQFSFRIFDFQFKNTKK